MQPEMEREQHVEDGNDDERRAARHHVDHVGDKQKAERDAGRGDASASLVPTVDRDAKQREGAQREDPALRDVVLHRHAVTAAERERIRQVDHHIGGGEEDNG